MRVDYINCNPLDALGLVPHAVYRLRFVPQSVILPDSWLQGNWPSNMREQLGRIGATGYLYAAQGEPTIVDDSTHGRAGVVDCLATGNQSAAPIQVAAQAVEDSYAHAKLVSVERISKLTTADAAKRPEEQRQTGEAAATAESANTPQALVKKYAGWALLIVALGVVAIVAAKAPRFGK